MPYIKTVKATKPQNVILYEGPSLIDGSPIVVIVTGLTSKSSNAKTGQEMLQTWILRSDDINPIQASRLGLDRGVCGDCIHRGTPNASKATGWADNRTCYVNLLFAPSQVYKGYKRGAYKRVTLDQIHAVGADRATRLGSFGDPAACPQIVWDELLKHSSSHTGYSHTSGIKGANGRVMRVNPKLMISADSKAQAHAYHTLHSKRTFRVIPVAAWNDQGKNALLKTEVLCPASKEGMREGVTCATCGLCDGVTAKDNGKLRKSIAIVAHGTARGAFKDKGKVQV